MNVMKLFQSQFQKYLWLTGWLCAGLLFGGCSHLYYADPNTQTPYVFPGSGQTAVAGTQHYTPPVASQVPPLAPVGLPPISPAPVNSNSGTTTDLLRTGDSITVTFSDIPPPGIFPVVQRIRDDGKITLPHNVTLLAAGRTVGQLQNDIRAAYVPNLYVDLTASVKSEERVFFVEGEVKLPSRLPYQGEMTVLRAITSAGGFTDFAYRKKIELRRTTGQKLMINWFKAIEDPKLDVPVYPNDQIIVHKKIW